MKKIKLYGKLAKKFGREFSLEVNTAAEAIRALSVVIPNFKDYLCRDTKSDYAVFVGYNDTIITNLHDPVSDKETIRIIPVVSGAGGLFRAVVGVALIVFSGGIAGAFAGTFLAGTITASAVASFGFSLLLGGLSQMLFSPPSADTGEQFKPVDNKPSYVFDGPINTTRQGNPVSVGYGRLLVGSQVISAGLSSEELIV